MREKLRAKWENFVYAVSARIPRLPRPWRVVRNLLCIPLTVYLIWLFTGGNPLTPLWAFRREEKLDMVGPSEILCEAEYRYYFSANYRWLLGETDCGYTSMACSKNGGFWGGWSGQLAYWPRGEEVTLVVRPGTENQDVYEAAWLYLFCEEPSAVRAEVDIEIEGAGSLNGVHYEFDRTYTVELVRNEADILCGVLLPADRGADKWTETLEEHRLDDLFQYSAKLPVTARLYGQGDELLLQTCFEYSYADPE